jgi:RNA polymerase sigma-54 factor
MGIQQKLHTKLVQKLILTPSLQQAIKLLPMSTLELSDLLNQEMVENPMLEEVPTEDLQPAEAAPAPEKTEPTEQPNKTDTWTIRTTNTSSATTWTTGIGRRRRRK